MTKTATSSQRYKTGLAAEQLSCWLLRLKGYRILERRMKCPVGEIDILAKRGRTVVAIEVKSRKDLALAREAISPRQWQRVARALDWWRMSHQENSRLQDYDFRFDAVLVSPGRWPCHILDAWRP